MLPSFPKHLIAFSNFPTEVEDHYRNWIIHPENKILRIHCPNQILAWHVPTRGPSEEGNLKPKFLNVFISFLKSHCPCTLISDEKESESKRQKKRKKFRKNWGGRSAQTGVPGFVSSCAPTCVYIFYIIPWTMWSSTHSAQPAAKEKTHFCVNFLNSHCKLSFFDLSIHGGDDLYNSNSIMEQNFYNLRMNSAFLCCVLKCSIMLDVKPEAANGLTK